MLKIYSSAFVLGLAILGIFVALFLVGKTQVYKPKAQVVGVSVVTQPPILKIKKGDSFSLDIFLDTAGQTINRLDLQLAFNSRLIEITSFESTNFFNRELRTNLDEYGFARLIMEDTEGKNSSTVVATLRGKALEDGVTDLSFTLLTKAYAIGREGDVLEAVSGSKIIVGESSQSIQQIPANVMDTYKDERRVERALEEFGQSDGAEPESQKESSNVVIKYSQRLIGSIVSFLDKFNSSIEKRAEEVIEKKE